MKGQWRLHAVLLGACLDSLVDAAEDLLVAGCPSSEIHPRILPIERSSPPEIVASRPMAVRADAAARRGSGARTRLLQARKRKTPDSSEEGERGQHMATTPRPARAGSWPTPRDRQRWTAVETKPFFVTSEFLFFALMSLLLLITAAVDDSIDARTFWYLEIPLTIGYLLSRGIAKSGSKTPSYDPRDEALTRARERMDN
jgi:hypothetical protein